MKFIRKNWEKLAIGIVLVLAFVIRFVNLTSYPAGFHADEASFGYDAFSILKTGRDQWGNFLPIVLKSFGDFKAPLYTYIDTIFVAIFGLTKFATRLPGPIIGTLSVFTVYILVNEILKAKKLGIAAAFFLAVNPWSIMLGRGAFESNLVTLLIPLGVYFFIKGIKSAKLLVWSSVFFGLGLFSYHSAKVIVPLVFLGLIFIFRNKLKKIGWQKLFVPLIVLAIFIGGALYTLSIGGGARVAERSITQGALEEGAGEKIRAINSGVSPTLAKIEHNKYQVVAARFIGNYVQYLSPRFLFSQGAGEATYGMIPGIGVINIFEGLMFIGLIPFFLKKSKALTLAILLWLLAAILPAALSTGVGYAGNRASGMLPAIQILATLGFSGWIFMASKWGRNALWAGSVLIAVLAVFNIYSFINKYFYQVPESFYKGMLFGDYEAAEWLASHSDGDRVIVSRSLSEPQIFIAFANNWNPSGYQWATKAWDLNGYNVPWVDQLPEYRLENYTFKSIDWKVDAASQNTILVAKPDDFPKSIKPSKIIYDLLGTAQIYVKIN